MAIGTITKNAKLAFSLDGSVFTNLPDLQSIGEIGGDAETIETTRLSDSRHTYIKGLGDQSTLECKFLYGDTETDSFVILRKTVGDKAVKWKITLPHDDGTDGLSCEFTGFVNVKVDAVEINQALTFTATITISSDMVWSDEA